MESLSQLREILGVVSDLNSAQALLGWDQETYMPAGGIEARAQQIATLSRLAHETFTSDRVGRLLEQAETDASELDPESDDAALVRVARRDWQRAVRVPSELVSELARASARAQQAWRHARSANDFEQFLPHLETILNLVRRKAEALGYEGEPYDALLDEYEPDMTTARVREIFANLRGQLVPLVQAIAARPAPEDRFLHAHYDEQAQWQFGLEVVRDFGFDFDRGRQDRSAHPFSTSFSVNDVRITTRVQPEFLPTGLFGTLHESGHAMYEQGVDPALERTLLASGTSLGMHESQSRLWENLVGRSRAFWRHYYGRLQKLFPEALAQVGMESFYAAINRVQPSLIRVEADEVTYNLHIMLRFQLETQLVDGTLPAAELPEAWNELAREMLGLTPMDDARGVLQDIHWSLGAIGYFPTYALGNLISAQLWCQVRRDLPDLDEQIASGHFAPLRGWLRERIHRHGRKFTASQLLERITGHPLGAEAWLRYVRTKFGELYGL